MMERYLHSHIRIHSVLLNWAHSFIHSSMALQPIAGPWPLLQFRNLLYMDGRTPWTSDQPVARLLPTHKHRINAHTDIHGLSGIRTHDPSFWASEESLCLRPRGTCNRQLIKYRDKFTSVYLLHYEIQGSHGDDYEHYFLGRETVS
jgi:hypothetical protein